MRPGSRRAAESTGMLLIGDAVLGLIEPAAHCRLWSGQGRLGLLARWFARHPRLARAFAAAELAAGLWIALHQQPEAAVVS